MRPSIDLRDFIPPLQRFVIDGIQDFRTTHPKIKTSQVSLYSSPLNGWVSLCFGTRHQKTLSCPDMDYVEFSMFEASAWSNIYEEYDQFRIARHDGDVFEFSHDTMGDEDFNHPFFDLISQVLKQQDVVKAMRSLIGNDIVVGVQMLDSQLNEVWELSDL